MTREELLEAQKEQTPLVWSPFHLAHDYHEIVVCTDDRPAHRSGVATFVEIRRALGITYTAPEHLRPATAQELLELAGEP